MASRWVITDREDSALQGLPLMAQVLYLRALRPFMDYGTGLVGMQRGISWRSLAETVEVEPRRGILEPMRHRSAVRRSIGVLERAGLVENMRNLRPNYLVFFLSLASRDESVRKKADTYSTCTWAPLQADGRQESRQPQSANSIRLEDESRPESRQGEREKADTPYPPKADTPPVSGNTCIEDPSDLLVKTSDSQSEFRPAPPPPPNLEEDSPKRIPYQQIVDAYHKLLPELPRVCKLTETRKAHIRARWQNELGYVDEWEKYFELVKGSRFLMGRTGGNGRRSPFRANFDFLIRESTLVKVVEGYYRD